MATASPQAPKHGPADRKARLVAYEKFIEQQIQKTSGAVKAVDVAGGLMLLCAAVLGYLLLTAMIDHWLVPGGMNIYARGFFFLLLVGGAGYYVARHVLPALFGRVNPLYSAYTIESSSPALKNSLLNFLLFRRQQEPVPQAVLEALEVQAATRLSSVKIDLVVDQSKVLKVGYALMVVAVLCALYTVFSPKSSLVSASRVLLPWADILPPSRVEIEDIRPGHCTDEKAIVRGDRLVVSAEIRGLSDDEPVTLYYSTADGQAVDRPIQMHVPAGKQRHVCNVPGGDQGVYTSLAYHIEAGDARSRDYQVAVVAAPTIAVEQVQYEYPDYTRYPARTVLREGDLEGIEGTRVTILARANYPIHEAWIDFGNDGKRDREMEVAGSEARYSFELALKKGSSAPEHDRYSLRFTNTDGRKNREPVEYRIAVIADEPPEVAILRPEEKELQLPINGMAVIETRAIDHDFALQSVELRGEVGRRSVLAKKLLETERQGQFVGRYELMPQSDGLRVGDVLDYWVIARDNKSPDANEAVTEKYRIEIVAADNSAPQPDRLARNDRQPNRPDQPQEQQPGEPQNDRQNQEQRQDQGEGQQQDNPQDGSGDKQQPAEGQAQEGQPQQGEGNPQPGQGQDSQPQQGADPMNRDGQQQPRDGQGEQQPNPDQPQPEQGAQEGDGEGAPRDGHGAGTNNPNQPGAQQQGGPGQQGQPQGGNRRSQGEAAPEDVAKDGSDDASAFRKLLEKAEQEAGQQEQNQSPNGQQQPRENTGDQDPQKSPQQQPESDGQAPQQPGQKASRPDRPGGHRQQQPSAGEQGAGDQRPDKPGQAGDTRPQQSDGQGEPQQKTLADQPGEKQSGEQKQQGSPADPSEKKPGGEQPGSEASGAQEQPGEEKSPQSGAGQEQLPEQPGQEKHPGGAAGEIGPQEGAQPDQGRPEQSGGDQGQGAQSKPGSDQQEPMPPEGQKSRPEAKGGDGKNDKGQAGSGQQGQDDAGSPDPQADMQQNNNKTDRGPGEQEGSKDKPQSPAHGKKESNSDGSQGGDKPGGGEEGGGQKANRRGTGSAGQNTAADQGGGKAEEAGGAGETSSQGGDDQQSQAPTGQPGEKQPGDGQGQKQSGGQKPGGSDQGDPAQQDSAEKQRAEGQPGSGGDSGSQPADRAQRDPRQPEGDGTSSGIPQGGNRSGRVTDGPDAKARPGDEANLDYARKKTDLVLQYLEDQLKKKELDPELKEALPNWERSDYERLMRDWQSRKQAAQQAGPAGEAARRRLDESLRNFGLRPENVTRRGSAANDTTRGLRESRRTPVPPEYAEQLKAYQRGLSTSQPGKKD